MKCKNCKIELTKANKYCHNCGGRIIKKRLTFKNLLTQANEEFFNYDNTFLKTIIDLIKKPEVVIDGYVKGVRKKYINPINFFGVSILLAGISFYVLSTIKDELCLLEIEVPDNVPKEAYLNMMEEIYGYIFDYGTAFNYVTIPCLALISYLIFFNKKYNFTEHMIIYLYTFALVTIISSLVCTPIHFARPSSYILVISISYSIILIYNSYVLIRIFNLSLWQFILRLLLFLIVISIFITGIALLLAMLFIYTGAIDPKLFALQP